MTTLGRHPDALAVKLTIGDGAHLVATSENGWAGPVTLHYGPKFGDPAISDPGTVDGDEVSWTLTEDQVEARAEHGWARLEDNGVTLAAGRVLVWRGGLGSTVTQTIASLTAGPPGPTAVSADADNLLKLGTDNLLMLDPDDLPAGGGDTTVQIGAVTLPESPTVGLSVSVLADSTTALPEGVTWDIGGEPTITERMLLVFVWSGDDWVGTYGPSIPDVPVAPDTTAPSVPTGLTATATSHTTIDLEWVASTDDVGVTGYEYRVDGGSAVDAGAGTSETVTGLDPETEYDFEVRAYDAAGNRSDWSSPPVSETTDALPADVTPPTPGTLAESAVTSDSFTLTVTGASDADSGLHATPYRFSLDDGASWAFDWQASNVVNATGLDPETEYTCVHQVRDAALNVATGSSIPVTTEAAGPTGLAGAIMALSPVGYWKLDETTGTTAADSSGNARHGTYTGSCTLAFNDGFVNIGSGSGDYIEIADADAFSLNTTPGLTFFALVRPISTLSILRYIARKGTISGNFEYALIKTAGQSTQMSVWNDEGGTMNFRVGATTLAGSTWHAVAATVSNATDAGGTGIALYVNNNTATSSTAGGSASGPYVNGTAPLRLGESGSTAMGHFAVFAGPLSAAQIGVLIDAARTEGLIP